MSLSQFKSLFEKSKKIFKEGRAVEALKVVEGVEPHASLRSEEQFAFLRYVSWLHLYYGDASKAARYFGKLFDEHRHISDAEGAMRSYSKSKDQKNKEKYALAIKELLKKNPDLKSKLTIASQNEFAGSK